MKRQFGSVTVLYGFNGETRFSGTCDKEEILEEGFAILKERGLELSSYTKNDVKWLWRDWYAEPDRGVAQLAVGEIGRELRDFRVICWLFEWYGNYGELHSISRVRPSSNDYALFFTIKGLLGSINLKNTSFYACVEHLRKLELHRFKDGEKKKVREYMRNHPEVVEKVRHKFREGEL